MPCLCIGEVRRARRGGHIPGAVNTPYRGFLAEGSGPDGDYRVFKGLDDIKKVGVSRFPTFLRIPTLSRRLQGFQRPRRHQEGRCLALPHFIRIPTPSSCCSNRDTIPVVPVSPAPRPSVPVLTLERKTISY